jgi:hypothetical protein
MTNGDDIHNLLKTLGHDAGIYQDLAKYNASRAAVRRPAMGRPTELAAGLSAASVPATPEVPPSASEVPKVLRLGPEAHASASSVSSILNRLASSPDPAPVHGTAPGTAPARPPLPVATPQPTRLDRLFGRLASRTSDPLGR